MNTMTWAQVREHYIMKTEACMKDSLPDQARTYHTFADQAARNARLYPTEKVELFLDSNENVK